MAHHGKPAERLSPVQIRAQRALEKHSLRSADVPLTKLYVEPTSFCNLNCRTCMRNSWTEPPGEMAAATFEHLIAGFARFPSLKTVAFWGFGEPLLNPRTPAMIARVKQKGLAAELITNGLLLDRQTATALLDAGLDRLVVSLDGAAPTTHADIRRGADLSKIETNVRGLVELRRARGRQTPEIGLEFVLMRRNLKELVDLIPLARRLEAKFVLITNLLPYSAEMKDEILYWMSAKQYSVARRLSSSPEIIFPPLDEHPEYLAHLQKVNPHLTIRDFPDKPTTGLEGYCSFIWEGSAAVTWSGEVSPCVALMHSHSCFVLGREKRLERHSVGNVNVDSLAAIWKREEYRRFRKRVRQFDFSPCTRCGGCELSENNDTDCIGSPFPTCGDCLWAKGLLLCP
ncbi:MAG: radical SAM protein [Myxococcales bacterium]|nr:radical SAM protein [Myxococcales bacterium]